MPGDGDFRRHADALRDYAQRLRRLFGSLGRLSDSGVAVSRAHHVSMNLRLIPQTGRLAGEQARWESRPNTDTAASFSREEELVEQWCEAQRTAPQPRPLLIVAPLGSGKSVLLETIAYKLGRLLESWAEEPSGASPPLVPMPVRLRALRFAHDEVDRFHGFLTRSQHVLSPADRSGTLSDTLFRQLLDAGALLCLFDGLDELPDLSEQGNIRRKVIDSAWVATRGFFVVTSRPICGDESALRDCIKHEIQPLDDVDVRNLIRHVAPSADLRHPAIGAYESCSTGVRSLLARPLFLTAWCRCPTALRTYGGVMAELYSQCFDHRRAGLHLVQGDPITVRPQLGALLKVFADGAFATRTHDDLSDCVHREPGFSGDIRQLLHIATATDLLTRVGQSAYFANRSHIARTVGSNAHTHGRRA